jgi:cell wall-associated NlpC family hydrolase
MHARADEIVKLARSLEHVRYRKRGRDLETGLDCGGVAQYIARTLGLSDHDNTTYGDMPDQPTFFTHLLKAGCTMIPERELAPGDILMIAMKRWPCHLGIYLGLGKKHVPELCHALLKDRRVTVVPFTGFKVRAVFRFPEGAA